MFLDQQTIQENISFLSYSIKIRLVSTLYFFSALSTSSLLLSELFDQ